MLSLYVIFISTSLCVCAFIITQSVVLKGILLSSFCVSKYLSLCPCIIYTAINNGPSCSMLKLHVMRIWMEWTIAHVERCRICMLHYSENMWMVCVCVCVCVCMWVCVCMYPIDNTPHWPCLNFITLSLHSIYSNSIHIIVYFWNVNHGLRHTHTHQVSVHW